MAAPLRTVVGTVASTGPGYEPQPIGPAFERDRVSGYFVDFSAKTTSAAPRTPAAAAQLALGWWERLLAGDAEAPERFGRAARTLARLAVACGDSVLFPYRVPVPKYGLRPPWYSALAQGQAASVFVRAATLGDPDDEFAALARAAARPLWAEPAVGGLVARTAAGPVLEEAPSRPPSLILNGWIFALLGLRDVSVGLGDGDATHAYRDGIACLRRTIDEYDVGWWTRYSLYPHVLPDLAKPFYHRLHVVQARILEQLTGAPEFAAAARRWTEYDSAPARARALAQKSVFVAVRSIRR